MISAVQKRDAELGVDGPVGDGCAAVDFSEPAGIVIIN
jgi:hypothetical protein